MKLIIDIPDKEYDRIKEWEDNITGYQTSLVLYRAVRNGIPLPEGHGDLIDRDELKTKLPTPIEDEYKTVYKIVDSMPSVIDADT